MLFHNLELLCKKQDCVQIIFVCLCIYLIALGLQNYFSHRSPFSKQLLIRLLIVQVRRSNTDAHEFSRIAFRTVHSLLVLCHYTRTHLSTSALSQVMNDGH